ncbi:MAG: AraC family transcriptional regulator [Chitinophagales bacterium]|nr:AraC family transcriptional regulator [Chitinophagales bacterium]MCZ2394183.1 AraC family transcriptional regulator [Chitinophagales bacterium]
MTKSSDIYFPSGEIEKTFINSIWRLSENELNERKEIILPKGTVEIIFNFSDTIGYFNPSLQVSKSLPTVFINGINFKPFELTKTGRQEFIGIQLNSIGLQLLFNTPAKEFNNSVLEGKEVCSQLDNIADQLFYNQTFSQQVEILLTWIRRKIEISNSQFSISRAKKLLSLGSQHHLTVNHFCEQVCLSDRQLRRFAQDWLSMNMEEFIQYHKYLYCLHHLRLSEQTLTEIGLEAGYYDQSHFIREFKSYTNLTPKQYRFANMEYLGHINVRL